ncbi:tripartite tricarboxylate transporter permease [Shumkonia mesophila]|uniref:tripartite tricarboxylate transporter permease n=1 Tax=Shumkonia mesophila TaxID=2838854 RepID=UPI0029350E69|nr:tripartite tricarboxylate transporter permease [Shumkonia mesophila]
MIDALVHAMSGVLAWQNLLAMVAGTIGGILVGALPGLTAAMGVAVLLPLTFTMDPLVGLGMMAGVYNGAIYGGSIPAILLRIPGTPAAIATTFDGYPMTQQGRAGQALQVAAVSSAVGGMMSAIALIALAPPLSMVTLAFGPSEMFWVGVFGLTSISVLLGEDTIKGLISAAIGLLIAMVGVDPMTGHERFTFGSINLVSGFNIVVLLIGLYALPPAIMLAEEAVVQGIDRAVLRFSGKTLPVRQLFGLWATWLRSSIIGIIVGILPGAGGNIAAFISYNEEKRTSHDPSSFGKGNPAGVAASECANNADNAAAMIPALTLGVPGSIVAALIMGGLLVQGLQPGPQLFRENPDIVYGFMIQMFLTAAMLFVFGGLVFARFFAQVLRIPRVVLMPMIIALTVIGVYVINNSTFDLYVVFGFGLLGYAMERLNIPLAPATLGLILGDMVESNLRRSLLLSQGDWTIFVSHGVSQIIIAVIVLLLAYQFFWKRARA